MNNLLCICMNMDNMLRYVTYLNILNNPRLNPNQVISEPVLPGWTGLWVEQR